MALVRIVRTAADLPEIDSAIETLALDFKGDVDFDTKEQRRELAKDCAGFGNAQGGTILVGAFEHRGVLRRYAGFTKERAARIVDAYDRAVRDLCSPVPVVESSIIDHETGAVVAINVRAYPLLPIGVLWEKDGGCPAYVFPLRSGSHTLWLRPEQLAMFMLPKVRTATILLESIPLNERSNVVIISRAYTGSASSRAELRFAGLDQMGQTVTFEEASLGEIHRVTLPLDAVTTSVWRNAGKWHVVIRGMLQKVDRNWQWDPL